MKAKYILQLFSLFLYNICLSQLIIPENCSELKESPANGKKMTRLIFDIDNDHKNDTATIVESNKEFSKFYLLIYLTSLDDEYQIELFHNDDFAIAPVQLEIKNNVLKFGYFEDNSAFGRFFKLRYDNTEKALQIIGYDSGYRLSDGNCNKSYNLITGKYDVTVITENGTKKTKIKKTGIKKIKPLYAENLNARILKKLDETGKEFEPK